MKIAGYTPAQIRKAILSALGHVATVLSVALAVGGIIPVAALPYVALVIGVATVYGVFRSPNSGVPRPAEKVPSGTGTPEV